MLLEAADTEYLGDARHRLQLVLHDPVLDGAQLLQAVVARGVLEVVIQDQAHAGGDGPHFRLAKTLGDLLAGLLQAFVDQSAGEVDVQVVFEIDVDHRQAEVGDAADFLDAGKTRHRGLNRIGDVTLDLLWRQTLGDGEDLHQVG